jgi:hypothetical protein
VIVGFTGTREGMSREQADQLGFVLAILMGAARSGPPEFHYGTHEGVQLRADEEAAETARAYGFRLRPHHARRGEELARDRRMVAAIDVLVAAPLSDREEQRSGTWATVRYMRASRKPVIHLSRGRT